MASSEQEEGGQPGQQLPFQSKLNVITFDDDGESHYAVEDDIFSTFAQKKGFQEENDKYSIVAIMGGQSGGKSTLLNLLFGTRFAVLESQERRGATTKGIWVSASEHYPDTFVMDLEGTDSDEKEEALVETFARQASRFVLAVAEVLIINMWAHDIGRRKAQNLVDLETIFESYISLFQEMHSNKTVLVFAIRDFNPAKFTQDDLKDRIMNNITGIWDRIEKSEYLSDKTLQDVFCLEFAFLRNLEYEPDSFEEDIANMRERFEDTARDDSFFNTDIHLKKTQEIPISHLNRYLKQLWESIVNSDQLNVVESGLEELTSRQKKEIEKRCPYRRKAEKTKKQNLYEFTVRFCQGKSVKVRVLFMEYEKRFPGESIDWKPFNAHLGDLTRQPEDEDGFVPLLKKEGYGDKRKYSSI